MIIRILITIIADRINREQAAIVGLHLLLAAVHVLPMMVVIVMVILILITLLVAQVTAFHVHISDNNIVP